MDLTCSCEDGKWCPHFNVLMTPTRRTYIERDDQYAEHLLATLGQRTKSYAKASAKKRKTRAERGTPGTVLTAMFAEIGGIADDCKAGCKELAAWMDEIGIDGCKRHRNGIALKLAHNASKMPLEQQQAMFLAALSASWAADVDPADTWGSTVDIAIKRAEAAIKPAKKPGKAKKHK